MILKVPELNKLKINVKKGDLLFFYGDLGSGKTTFIKYIVNNLLGIKEKVKSPTYIHYKKLNDNIYHFDLYRLENYDDFVNIGGEEILDNKKNICFVEWPEVIEKYYKPTIKIYFNKVDNDEDTREIIVNYESGKS